jgi:hypothetical protein
MVDPPARIIVNVCDLQDGAPMRSLASPIFTTMPYCALDKLRPG